MSYIGNQVTTVPFITDTFSGTGSATAFTLTRAPAGTAAIAVFVASQYTAPVNYSLSGTTLNFNSAPASGTNNIVVLHLGNGSTTQVPSDGSVTSIKLGAAAVTGDKIGLTAINANNIVNSSITGDKIAPNTIGTSNLATTGVVAGVYGSSSNVASITVGADGRITSASNVAVSGIDAHPFVFTALGS